MECWPDGRLVALSDSEGRFLNYGLEIHMSTQPTALRMRKTPQRYIERLLRLSSLYHKFWPTLTPGRG